MMQQVAGHTEIYMHYKDETRFFHSETEGYPIAYDVVVKLEYGTTHNVVERTYGTTRPIERKYATRRPSLK